MSNYTKYDFGPPDRPMSSIVGGLILLVIIMGGVGLWAISGNNSAQLLDRKVANSVPSSIKYQSQFLQGTCQNNILIVTKEDGKQVAIKMDDGSYAKCNR